MMLINSKEQEKKINDDYKKYSRDVILSVVSSRTTEEIKFYTGLIKDIKNDMREQLDWEDSKERYHMMENLAQSDFVKSIFKMKGDE